MNEKLSKRTAVTLAACFLVVWAPISAHCEETVEKPVIDVVFCLDSTGSMGSEIKAAKDKIWSIANKLLKGEPRPILRVGVVTFRDRGDEYITRKIDLTDDIDSVYEFLSAIKADGGGDGPEDVRTALHVCVNELSWGKTKNTLKMIFLVGDAPPHTDYAKVPSCSRTASKAAELGININTLACGTMGLDGIAVWKRVAELSDGQFQKLPRSAGPHPIASMGRPGKSPRRMMLMDSASDDCAPSACESCSKSCPSAGGGPPPPSAADDADAFEDAVLGAVKRKAAEKGIKY